MVKIQEEELLFKKNLEITQIIQTIYHLNNQLFRDKKILIFFKKTHLITVKEDFKRKVTYTVKIKENYITQIVNQILIIIKNLFTPRI
jgi:hypothetical protein